MSKNNNYRKSIKNTIKLTNAWKNGLKMQNYVQSNYKRKKKTKYQFQN